MNTHDLLDQLDLLGRSFDRWERPDYRTHKATAGPFTITVNSRPAHTTWTVEHAEDGVLQQDVPAEVVSYARIEAIFYASNWVRQHITV